ncbi:MAG: helix-turn-helix transcriptional regulator [Rectinemataceae bacterium]
MFAIDGASGRHDDARMVELGRRAGLVSRRVGRAGTVLFTGLSGGEILEGLGENASVGELFDNPLALVYLGAALLCLASARFAALRSVQPALLLAMVPVQTIAGAGVLGGLAFALASVLLFLRLGFFRERGAFKASAIGAAVAAADLGAVLFSPDPRAAAGPALSCAAVFCVLARAMAKRKMPAALAVPREPLSLDDYNLSTRELQFLSARSEGKTSKEIGFEFGVSDTTVRNILMSAYRKLGIRDARELGALGERYAFRSTKNIKLSAVYWRRPAKKSARGGGMRRKSPGGTRPE